MADLYAGGDNSEKLPLKRYRGKRPEAPDWFVEAVNTNYTTEWVDVDGAKIHYQTWGDRAKPGLLLVHGNGAHAHWYDFIAPALLDTYYVVAITLGGMGDSSQRPIYNIETFSRELLAVAVASGLNEDGRKPILVAHSFGGFVGLFAAADYADQFAGLVVVDSAIRRPDDPHEGPPERSRPNRIYPSFEAALARFRLAPAQPCENHFIVDYIGRHSLKEVDLDDGSKGWTWKFDPFIWRRFEFQREFRDVFVEITCPLALMRGADSVLVTDDSWAYMRELRPDILMSSVDNAQHHVMLDQPLDFVEKLKALLRQLV